MTEKIQIGIAEDHELVRDGFVSLLAEYHDLKVVFEAGNGKELLKKLKEFTPHIVLLDIEMPILGGMGAMAEIRQRYPTIKIIVISAHSEPGLIVEYVKLGASSFLPKNCKKNTLVKAIYNVYSTGMYFEDDVLKLLAKNGTSPERQPRERKLTESEIQVLGYLREKKSFEDIAVLMNIDLKTARWYSHILRVKTNTKDLAGLIEFAEKQAL